MTQCLKCELLLMIVTVIQYLLPVVVSGWCRDPHVVVGTPLECRKQSVTTLAAATTTAED